jgi:uncharacterized protein YyaL (SSP411 family)
MQVRFRRRDYDWACEIADALLARFEDPVRGGFYFTSHDHEKLFHRGKPGHDNATPSGNGAAARALAMLSHVASEPRYLDAAQRAVDLFAGDVARSPAGCSTLLESAAVLEAPPPVVVLTGQPDACAAWRRRLAGEGPPGTVVLDVSGADDLPAALVKGMPPARGAAAYVCRGTTCLPPIATVEGVLGAIAPGVR